MCIFIFISYIFFIPLLLQAIGLLATYCLLTYDALCAQAWPALDDVVYYTRATTRVFEFIVAVFVVGAGVKETLAGQWTAMNVLVLIIHCYFNVFQRLQQGWKSFLLRLEAAKKISGLPSATSEQLLAYNDVCSICFSDMSEACITSCSHLFHPPCLRKWLYVQDKCPLCQTSITVPGNQQSQESEELDDWNEEHRRNGLVGETIGRRSSASSEELDDSIESEVGANLPILDDSEDDNYVEARI